VLKIAFYTMIHEGWTVGEIYLRNLFYALRRTYGKEVGLYLLEPAGLQNAKTYASSIEADEVVQYNRPQRWTLSRWLNAVAKNVLQRDMVMEGFLGGHKIDVLFSHMLIHKYQKIATLSWLPDFQHVHLPEMFTTTDCISRDKTFLHYAKVATRMILMSEAVKKDLELFAPMYVHKARVLHPISHVPELIYEYDLNSILDLYHLPEKFVYMPNQFWKHKNHEMVFRAVKILKDRGVKISVVCTGNPVDLRHPSYFADLCLKLSEWNIRDQIICLGLIPREHVLLLMRQSVCVLNPSLFEGWGYTVDEARSVGKRVLLSDIPTHREQNPPKATFFNSRDCDALTDKLGQIWLSTEPGPDVELEFEARRILPGRLRAYGEKFFLVAQEAAEEARG
jgi:glycosyltransferase involved in cell wall biosynthesis